MAVLYNRMMNFQSKYEGGAPFYGGNNIKNNIFSDRAYKPPHIDIILLRKRAIPIILHNFHGTECYFLRTGRVICPQIGNIINSEECVHGLYPKIELQPSFPKNVPQFVSGLLFLLQEEHELVVMLPD